MERLLAWYRVTSSFGAVAALIAANLVPLAGVLFLGWSVWTILTVYWVENGIVGFYNVLKMAVVPGIGKLGVIPFFLLHYGLFWFVHGVFVLTLPAMMGFGSVEVEQPIIPGDPFRPLDPGAPWSAGFDETPTERADMSDVVLAAIALMISHGVSYLFNFIRRGEHRRTTAMALMAAPYQRVVVLHMTILLGAFAVAAFGAHWLPLVILVVLKTAIDLAFHLREHRAAPDGRQPSSVGGRR